MTKKGISRVLRRARPGFRTGRSESDPIVTAMRGFEEESDFDIDEDCVGVGSPFRSARIESVSSMRGVTSSSACDMELPIIVI